MTRTNVALGTVIIALACLQLASAYPLVTFSYHSYNNLTERLRVLANTYPNTSYLYSIGKSVENRDLWVMAIGKQPQERVLLRPNIKFVGSIHGDEAPPKEILLHFIEYLLNNYGKNENVTSLVDSTLIHVLPLMNPDGSARALQGYCEGPGRENANGTDLNRNFPDYFHPTYLPDRQPETEAIIKWMRDTRFVLSASLHVGAMLVNIPYDNYEGSMEDFSMLAPTPDDDVFRHFAAVYSLTHPEIHQQNELCDIEFHPDSLLNGIINGADWYATNGTMLDYNYVFGSCVELNLELGCCKFPRAAKLRQIWLDNRDALISLARGAHMGVRGQIVDEKNKPVTDATVKIDQRMPVNVSSNGEFWKLLLPSSFYLLEVTRAGRSVWRQNFMVVDGNVTELYINLGNRPPVVIIPGGLTTAATSKSKDVTIKSGMKTGALISGSEFIAPRWSVLLKTIAFFHLLIRLRSLAMK